MPYIFSKLTNLTVPEVDFDGGYFKNIVVDLPQPALEDVQVLTVNAKNGLELTAANIAASMTADFSYSVLFLTVTGTADINIKTMGIDMEIDMSTQPSTPAYELAPFLNVSKSVVNINPDDVDITLSGGAVAKIASVFIPFIKNTVIPEVITQVQTTIQTTVDVTMNADLAVYGSQELIPYLGGVTVDYAQMIHSPYVTTDNIFEIQLNGTFFDSLAVQASKYSPVAFPIHNPEGKGFQGIVTEYAINTFFEAGY